MNQEKEVLVLMYHYVKGDATPYLKNLYGPTNSEFEDQLKLLKKHYTFIDYNTFRAEIVDGMDVLPSKSALVTFDDGTADNMYNAIPVLNKLGLSAVFFLISACITERTFTAVHARHLIAAKIGNKQFKAAFLKLYNEYFDSIDELLSNISPSVYKNAYRWDDEETARFKYAVNFGLDPVKRAKVLKVLFEKEIGDWEEWGNRFYLKAEHLKEMKDTGHFLGGHSHKHEALGLIAKDIMQKDIKSCGAFFESMFPDEEYFPFSYPYGKQEHFNKDVIEQLKENNFETAFVNLQGSNNVKDISSKENARYKILRIDPKDIPNYV